MPLWHFPLHYWHIHLESTTLTDDPTDDSRKKICTAPGTVEAVAGAADFRWSADCVLFDKLEAWPLVL